MYPKILHLTVSDKNNITNPIWIQCLKKYRELYTDYTIKLYDNKDIYRIVAKHNIEHLEDVKNIKIGAILADLFRYLILYLEGGIYSDMDCMPLKPIEGLLKEKGESANTILCYEFHKDYCNMYPEQICQWFMITEPRQKIFIDSYNEMIRNIKVLQTLDPTQPKYESIVMDKSGPRLFTRIINKNFNARLLLLESPYFCAGSGNEVPTTDKSYIKHCFTGSWRK